MGQQKLTTQVQHWERRERRQRQERGIATILTCCQSQDIPPALFIQSAKEPKGSLIPAYKGRAGALLDRTLDYKYRSQIKPNE